MPPQGDICLFPCGTGKNTTWGVSHPVKTGRQLSTPVHSSLGQAFETERQEGTGSDSRQEEMEPYLLHSSSSPVEHQVFCLHQLCSGIVFLASMGLRGSLCPKAVRAAKGTLSGLPRDSTNSLACGFDKRPEEQSRVSGRAAA